MTEEAESSFSSTLPIIVYSCPQGAGQAAIDWQEVDRGPGYFTVPADQQIGIRIKSIDDSALAILVDELRDLSALVSLDLSENRNLSNESLAVLKGLPQLEMLNLSSTNISSQALNHLKALPNLHRLFLLYCNRLNDSALKILKSIHQIQFVDLQGCLGITNAAFSRVRRRSLSIHR